MDINYRVTSIIWLSLESVYKRGLTPEQAREIIESIDDPGSRVGAKLRCEEQYINNNWNVRTTAVNPDVIEDAVWMIEDALESALADGQKEI